MTTFPSLRNFQPYVVITLLAALLFIPFLGKVHLFDWDEINFAESAREMLLTGNYTRVMIDYVPFWEKPPLFFWLQVISMKTYGINEFAARLPNAICGIITLCLIFYLGRKYFDDTFGWLWVLAYIGSFLPHFYFKSGIIDPWFNLFIFSGIAFLIAASSQKTPSAKHFALSGLFAGMAILTKGPAGLLIILLTSLIYLFSNTKWINAKSLWYFLLAALVISSIWVGAEMIQHGTGLLREFIVYQVRLFSTTGAGHSGPFYYHAMVLMIGCFPASLFALIGFFKKCDADSFQLNIRLWMIILFMVVLILFSIAKTKIIHYSSLCYLPLTFLAVWEIYFRVIAASKVSKVLSTILLAIGLTIGFVAALIPYFGNHTELIIPYLKDSFVKASLEAEVVWPPHLMLIGIMYVVIAIASFILLNKNLKHGVAILFVGTCIFIQLIMFFFAPRIERYSQGAAIDFYKSLQGKDVYVEVLGFKSFAHLFYTLKQPQENPKSDDKQWLLHGEIDKPAYFVCKINKAQEYALIPQLEEIERKNGFVFFRRNPP